MYPHKYDNLDKDYKSDKIHALRSIADAISWKSQETLDTVFNLGLELQLPVLLKIKRDIWSFSIQTYESYERKDWQVSEEDWREYNKYLEALDEMIEITKKYI